MKSLLRIAGAIDALSTACARIGTWLVLISCLICAGVAGLRYGLNLGSNAWLEIQWYLFAAMVMLGGPYVLKVNEHVRVDIFYGRLDDRNRARLDLAGLVVFLLPTTLLLGWLSWHFFQVAWQLDEGSPNPGGLARWPVKLLLPAGFALLTLQGLAEIVKRIGHLRGAYRVDTGYEKPLQ